MPDKILESVLSGELDLQLLLTWLRGDNLEGAGKECLLRRCGRNEFTAYFLSFLRAETDSIVENDSAARAVVGTGTPERSDGKVHRRTASDPTADTPAKQHHSPNRDKKRSGRKVKTKLFSDNKEPSSPDEGRLTTGIDRLALATSTPLKSESASPKGDTRSPAVTPSESRSRHSRHDATFGDFLTTASKVKKKRNSRNSDDSREDVSSETAPSSNSCSARKSNSLRSEKRRIKPTNIDLSKKSVSLNNFHSEFQRVGALALENNEVFSAPPLLHGESFSGSPGFAAERDALRRERHRLLEKFSSLSAATSPKCTTPIIKISQDDDSFILPDVTKVTCEDVIEVLVKVYSVLLDCHLTLSYTSELCFLLALLRGRQKADVNISISAEPRSVLRSVHNAACFAARALRSQRAVLAALLDRPSLRALAEARVTRTMAPDLSKSLLDVYGVRGDTQYSECARGVGGEGGAGEGVVGGAGGHVVGWNAETDGADNFPSALSFHSFKKQRDMFYDISRWYEETGGGGAGGGAGAGGPSLRTRVRALLAAGAAGGHANYAHLGVLVARHALAALTGGGSASESRLSKLQRRLTRPPAHQANSLFTPEEEFYRELLSCSENEPFRAAVRDALATELLAIDAAPVHNGAMLISVSRRAATLAKLLGLLAALPYCPQHQPVTSRASRPLPYILALRSYASPALDVHALVLEAARCGRLCVTLPWSCAYACALAAHDAHGARTPPLLRLLRLHTAIYRSSVISARTPPLLRLLRLHTAICRRRLPCLPTRTALYLRCVLSMLFAQPNIPQEILYEEENDEIHLPTDVTGLDSSDIITEQELAALSGARKEIALLLSGGGGGGGASGGGAGGPRHVTPLRVGPSPNSATQRYTHIQKRLEEAVVRGCGGAGARRVLELVCERVSAAALTNCTRALASHRHKPSTPCDVSDISKQGAEIRAQLEAALGALVAERGGRGALSALAERAVRARLHRHARGTEELCDSAIAALRSLVGSSWSEEPTPISPPTVPTVPTPPTKRVDMASALIDLKECVCLVLEQAAPPEAVLCAALEAVGGALGGGAGGAGAAGARGVRRAALQLSVELCVALACSKPEALTDSILRSAECVWAVCVPHKPPTADSPPPDRGQGDSRAPTPDSDDGGPPRPPPKIIISTAPVVNEKAPEADPDDLTETFARIISPRVVQQVSLGNSSTERWEALLALAVFVSSRGWLSAARLTESCVALYTRDWPQEVLTPLSAFLRALAAEVDKFSGGDAQLALFLGFLGEYCDDLALPND